MRSFPVTVAPGDVPFVTDAQAETVPERVAVAVRAWIAAATERAVTNRVLGDATAIPAARVTAIMAGTVSPTRFESGAFDFVLGTSEAPRCHPARTTASVPQSAPAPKPMPSPVPADGKRAARWRELVSAETRTPPSIARGANMSHARLCKLLRGAPPTAAEALALDAYLTSGRRAVAAKRIAWPDEIASVGLNVADVVRRARLDASRGRKIVAGSVTATDAERGALLRAIERERARLA